MICCRDLNSALLIWADASTRRGLPFDAIEMPCHAPPFRILETRRVSCQGESLERRHACIGRGVAPQPSVVRCPTAGMVSGLPRWRSSVCPASSLGADGPSEHLERDSALHGWPFDTFGGRAGGATSRVRGHRRGGHPYHPTLAREPAVQHGRASRGTALSAAPLYPPLRARGSTPHTTGLTERGLAQRELSRVRGLHVDRGVPARPAEAARAVRRGAVSR
jgi:hypothetical protein